MISQKHTKVEEDLARERINKEANKYLGNGLSLVDSVLSGKETYSTEKDRKNQSMFSRRLK